MNGLPPQFFLALSFTLFAIGAYIAATKRNLIRIIMGLEVMVAACNVAILALGRGIIAGVTDPLAQTIVVVSIAVGAGGAALGLALAVVVFRRFKTLDVGKLSELRG